MISYMKLSVMDSCLVPLPLPRPSELVPRHYDSLMYLTGFASQAIDQVAKEVADLPPTRGFWDYTRAVINQMIGGADPFGSPVQLLKANGLHWQPCGAPDRIRFRLIDCPQVITLRARPAEAPAPDAGGGAGSGPLDSGPRRLRQRSVGAVVRSGPGYEPFGVDHAGTGTGGP